MGVREVLAGLGWFVGVFGRVWSVWGRVEPVGDVSVGLFGWVWAGSAELWQAADTGEGGEVKVGPRPPCGEAQDQFSSVVHDPSREAKEAGADSVSVGQCLSYGAGVVFYPPVEVVSQGGARKPGGVGEEVPRRAVRQPGVLFEVSYCQLRAGMCPVIGIGLYGRWFGVGGEGMVSPVGPQLRLGGIRQSGAAYHHPHPTAFPSLGGTEGGLGHLRFAALGIADGFPLGLFDVGDSRFDLPILGYGDRPFHSQTVQISYQTVRPEPRIGPYRHRTPSTYPSDRFTASTTKWALPLWEEPPRRQE